MKISTLFFSLFALAAQADRYGDVLNRMDALQKKHDKISQIFSIGTNDDGVEIKALRVSITPQIMDPKKIGQIVVSTHHGNEDGAPEFTLKFIEDLLGRYQSSELWRGNLADMEWTIIPVLNISGYNLDEREEYSFDPNRDYPGPCTPDGFGKLKSIRQLLAFYSTRSFVGSVTVHGYDGSLTYPWGFYTDNYDTLDKNYFDALFAKAAEKNGYKHGNGAELIYAANGCYEDYVYWKYGSWSLLLELRDGSAKDIDDTVGAIRTFYDQLNSSVSLKNEFQHKCIKQLLERDLRVE